MKRCGEPVGTYFMRKDFVGIANRRLQLPYQTADNLHRIIIVKRIG
jgi:hypothetical protein